MAAAFSTFDNRCLLGKVLLSEYTPGPNSGTMNQLVGKCIWMTLFGRWEFSREKQELSRAHKQTDKF